MSASRDLMARLAGLDVKLELDGDRLRIDAPKGVLTPELKEELAAGKPELVALLTSPAGGIRPAPAGADIPLTSGQERLRSLIGLQPDSGVYNVPMAYRLRGDLDVDALERSLDAIQRRHTILRTAIRAGDGEPRQRVADAMPFVLRVTDLTGLAEAGCAAAVDRALDAEIQRPFDIERAPLWRCALLRLAADDHLLIFTMHHIVFDRFSKTVFLRELEAFYAGEDVPDLALQYRDFAFWQRSEPRRELAEGQMEYWEQRFRGVVSELMLPTDHPRPAAMKADGRSQTFRVPSRVREGLSALSRAARGSLYMTLLAAYHALLHRYTGQTDQIICSPFACRNNTRLETLIGYFNNILPMRTDLSGDPSFRDLLGRVRQVTMDAARHQDAPFQRIASLPNLALTPLTRALFNFRSEDSSVLTLRGLTATAVESRRHQADFDLALYVGMENRTLTGVLDYNAGIFEEETIRSMLSHFLSLLDAVATDPDRALSTLPSLRRRFPDIETALVRHPKVDEAIVVVRSDAVGRSHLAAYLVLNEDDVPSRRELRSVLGDQLREDHEKLALIPLDEIPLLPDGAVDIGALPAPTLSRNARGDEYVAPRTALEEDLVEVWRRVLWRDERIGIHDNFFDLGGHSLLSVQLIEETKRRLRRPVPWAALGQLSTIAEFVDFLEHPAAETARAATPGLDADLGDRLRSYTVAWKGQRSSPDSLVVGLNTDAARQPVFWCVQRYLNLTQLARHLGPEQPIYGMRSGHNVMEKTPENIRALAVHYADEITRIQSHGPFIVGGICQAAEIALQMALRLMDLGHEVNLLGLQERFVPLDYPGRVAFFFGDASDRSPYFHFATPELGWRKYYTGGFEAHLIPGAHGTYFREENIPYLAREMRGAFDGAQDPLPAEDRPALQRLPRSAYRAKLAVAKPVAAARDEARLVINVGNTSAETWLASQRSGVFLGARWRDPRSRAESYTRYAHATQTRSPLPTDLKPGGTVALELAVTIPEDPDLRILEIDMVDEGITWFADTGSEAVRIEMPRA